MVEISEADWNDPAHCEAVVNLIDAYAREPIEGGKPLPKDVAARMVPGLSEHPTAFALLAYIDSAAVGVAICFVGFSTFAGKPLINIHDLAVLAEHRGRGIGTALLEAINDRARSLGCGKVTLEVRAENRDAQRLYERTGFGDPGGNATRFLECRFA